MLLLTAIILHIINLRLFTHKKYTESRLFSSGIFDLELSCADVRKVQPGIRIEAFIGNAEGGLSDCVTVFFPFFEFLIIFFMKNF